MGSLAAGGASIFAQSKQAGCHKDGENYEQFYQQQVCICGHNLQVFKDYKFLDADVPALRDAFTEGATADQRNLLMFKEPKFCQAPSTSYAKLYTPNTVDEVTMSSNPLRIPATDADLAAGTFTEGHLHREKCLVKHHTGDYKGQEYPGIIDKFAKNFPVCYYSAMDRSTTPKNTRIGSRRCKSVGAVVHCSSSPPERDRTGRAKP
jgi:hypothetical protein